MYINSISIEDNVCVLLIVVLCQCKDSISTSLCYKKKGRNMSLIFIITAALFSLHFCNGYEFYHSYYTGANLFSLNDGCTELLGVKQKEGEGGGECTTRVNSDLVKALAGCADAMKGLDDCYKSEAVTAEGLRKMEKLRRVLGQTEVVLADCPNREKEDLTKALDDCTHACSDVMGCD